MGKIFVVGLGPGNQDEMTPHAVNALEHCDVILGYNTYIELIASSFSGKDLRASPMRQEENRCREALTLALEGKTVGLISSGDAGVYGMAGPMLEIMAHTPTQDIAIEIIPGVTALLSTAAILGAPLMHDFAVISLSNLLTPWELIERRLTATAQADFVLCLYNPASRGRPENLRRACELLLQYKNPATPAGWVRNAGREGMERHITTLENLKSEQLDMFCTVIIGNSNTKILDGRIVTPRGYKISGVNETGADK